MRIRNIVGGAVAALVLSSGAAHAVTITFTTPLTGAASLPNAQAGETAFLAGLYGVTTWSFETPAAPYTASPLVTPVGTFSQVLAGTLGGACNTANTNFCDDLAVLDAGSTPFDGRFATGGNQWLDSNDSQQMSWVLPAGVTAVGFYMTDPNDAGGRMAITAFDGSSTQFQYSNIFGAAIPNGGVTYITLTDLNGIAQVDFYSNDDNDGFGIDLVSTGSPVPEPATLLLLGSGLTALAMRRRKRS